jgi:hypothetical protein
VATRLLLTAIEQSPLKTTSENQWFREYTLERAVAVAREYRPIVAQVLLIRAARTAEREKAAALCPDGNAW